MTPQIYLDYNATTPVDGETAAAMSKYLSESYGNPSSAHRTGLAARDAVEKARSQVAALLCCDATEVIFTSGGTEANNMALKGLFFARRESQRPFHVVTSVIEHPAVLEPCRFLERLGAEVTRVPVDRRGLVDPDDVRRAIRPYTALVSIMHANNEVGTIQPLAEIAAISHSRGVLLHSDAAQTVGKIPVDVESLGVDLLSVAGHKLYGPKGVGALIVREGIELEPLLHGADHEAGRRAGTENVPSIVGLGAACESAQRWIDDRSIEALRDRLWRGLQESLGDELALHGHPTLRLPNTLNVGFRGRVGGDLLAAVPHISVSTGSACHAGRIEASPVLREMGIASESATGAVRFSLGRETTSDEIDAVIAAFSSLGRHFASTI